MTYNCPCRGCDHRVPPDCHVHCKEYKEFQTQCEARIKAREKESAACNTLSDRARRLIQKYQRYDRLKK